MTRHAAPARPRLRQSFSWLRTDSLQGKLSRGAGIAFVVKAVGLVVGFLVQVVAARLLGTEGYGIFAYVTGWIALLALLATLGLHKTVLRFASAYLATQDWSAVKGVMHYAKRRIALAAALVVLLGWVGLASADGALSSGMLGHTFAVGLLGVPILALLPLQASFLRSLGHVAVSQAPDTVLRQTLTLFAMSILVVDWPAPAAPQQVMACWVVGALLALVFASVVSRRASPPAIEQAVARVRGAEWRRTALPLLLSAASQTLLRRTDVIMIGLLLDMTAAGLYAAAAKLAGIAMLSPRAITVITAPTLAKAFARQDRRRLQATMTWSARMALASVVTVAVPIVLLATPLLTFFGSDFAVAAGVLPIILLGTVVHASTGSIGNLMNMTGLEKPAAITFVFAAILNIVLNAILIRRFGIAGAAAATAISMASWNLAMAVLAWRRLGVVAGPIGDAKAPIHESP